MSHLTISSLWPVHQSPDRKGYLSESGVLFCSEIIAKLLNEGKLLPLIALDLSSVFDTVDLIILLSSLEHFLGIKGTVLKLFNTCLHNRKNCLAIAHKCSGGITTHTGDYIRRSFQLCNPSEQSL